MQSGIITLMLLAVCAAGMPISLGSAGTELQVSVAYAQSTTATVTTGSAAPSTGAAASAQPTIPTDCTFGWTSLGVVFNPTCWGRTIGAIVSGVLVAVAGWILTIAGALFDYVVGATILTFGTFVNSNVITAINAAWSAFRDIANIVIISMFTFIAISTILGSHDYGAKKMVAKVLIVAVLINFSLLFTKIIIDVSNFTAIQFYSAALPQFASSANSGSGSQTQSPGIAEAFMAYAGVSGFSDTRQAVSNLADSINDGNIAFLHGIFIALILFGAAVVLFYGSFLLISRGILMIFLMVTSSIAFATYLIPKASSSNYGWSAWWESLLKNAIFAPLLMVFLAISLAVGNAVKAQSGSLGDLLANPTKTLDVNALFGYLVVLGLLFASLRAASSFSKTIGGFDYASIVPGLAYGGAGAAGSWAARGLIGGGAAALARNEWLQRQTTNLGINRPFNAALYGAAARSWDPRSLPGAKQASKMVGLDLGTATGKGGYLKQTKDSENKVEHRKEAIQEMLGTKSDKEKDASRVYGPSKAREEAHQTQYDKTKEKHDPVAADLKALISEQTRLQKESAAKELEVARAQASGDTAAERRHQRDARELKQNIREQGNKIAKAQEKLAPLAAKMALHQGEISKEKEIQKPVEHDAHAAHKREETYAKNVGNERYISLFFSGASSRDLSAKLLKELGKSQDQKTFETITKQLAKLKDAADAHAPEPHAEPHAETHEPAASTSAPSPSSHGPAH